MNLIPSYFEDFLALFFPELCASCGKNLFKNESVICTGCLYHLPYTNFHLDQDNRASRQFYGKIPFAGASSFLYFKKGSKVQNLMHRLKYDHRPEVGIKLGGLYGAELKKDENFASADLIVPVPLHPAKIRKRGYNQSECFAQGLSSSLNIPVDSGILYRSVSTASQTQKGRFERYENMRNAFGIKNSQAVKGKHILLVDDVLTTGATLEACAGCLQTGFPEKISIITLAFAG